MFKYYQPVLLSIYIPMSIIPTNEGCQYFGTNIFIGGTPLFTPTIILEHRDYVMLCHSLNLYHNLYEMCYKNHLERAGMLHPESTY